MKKCLIALSLAALALSANAQQYYGNGYTIVRGDSGKQQHDLSTLVFKSIQASDVRGGLIELLSGSGWRLAEDYAADPDITRLYNQPYPEFKRTLNPLKLHEALQYIAGPAWDVVVDPVNKLVSFQLSKRYRCFTMEDAVCTAQP